MKNVRYKVSIIGMSVPDGAISFSNLQTILTTLTEGAERALRLIVEGQSVRKGPTPAWLSKSVDFVLTGIQRGSTALLVDAPTLSASAPEQITQQSTWLTLPEPNETAFSVLAKAIQDMSSEYLESERFDSGLLDTMLRFGPTIAKQGIQIKLAPHRRQGEGFVLDHMALSKIEKIKQTTPEPQAVIVSGLFDTIEHSRKRFRISMKHGVTLHGGIEDGNASLEEMRSYWGRNVTIKGLLHYKATGKPRFLEAQVIELQQPGDEIFESVNVVRSAAQILAETRSEMSGRDIVSEIWGKWPGDEPIEQLLDALRQSG